MSSQLREPDCTIVHKMILRAQPTPMIFKIPSLASAMGTGRIFEHHLNDFVFLFKQLIGHRSHRLVSAHSAADLWFLVFALFSRGFFGRTGALKLLPLLRFAAFECVVPQFLCPALGVCHSEWVCDPMLFGDSDTSDHNLLAIGEFSLLSGYFSCSFPPLTHCWPQRSRS